MSSSVTSGSACAEIDKSKSGIKSVSRRRILLVAVLTMLLPWPVRRWLLKTLCRYSIHPTARIGLSLVATPTLTMGANARIGSLNVIKSVELSLGEAASVGNLNWISGVPAHDKRHFLTTLERRPALVLERHSAVTSMHFIDCCDLVHIGEFSTVAGARSQILTHAIDFRTCRQKAAAVYIGRYCFLGTACVVLKGARLPDYSILAAASCLNRAFEEPYSLYSGVPATRVKELDRESQYFHRQEGFVE